jgi:hypothetical protein
MHTAKWFSIGRFAKTRNVPKENGIISETHEFAGDYNLLLLLDINSILKHSVSADLFHRFQQILCKQITARLALPDGCAYINWNTDIGFFTC